MSKIHQNTRDWYFRFRCLGSPVAFTVGWLSPTSGGHCSVARIFFELTWREKKEWIIGLRNGTVGLWDQTLGSGPVSWSGFYRCMVTAHLPAEVWFLAGFRAHRSWLSWRPVSRYKYKWSTPAGWHAFFEGSGRRISLFKIRKIKKRTDRSITR